MTIFVRQRNTNYVPLPLVRPISRAGQLPDYVGALPQLGQESQGMKMAVGHPPNYIVYSYHFDQKSGTGNWSYLYSQFDGETVELPN